MKTQTDFPHQPQAFVIGAEVISKWVDSEIQYQISQFEANTESLKQSGMTIDSPLVLQVEKEQEED